jgi:hypothetical protein
VEDTTETDLKKILMEGDDKIDLAQYRDQRWDLEKPGDMQFLD